MPIPKTPKSTPRTKREGHIGNTLRSVYQETVGEDIPPEMLDLLGKLS